MAVLRLQLDLLQAKSGTGRLTNSISDIDSLLSELSTQKLEMSTPKSLDPLVPIAHLIRAYFSLEEVNDLAFETGINPEEIGGDTLSERVRSLVMYADGNNLLSVLLGTCQVKRPFVDWHME